MPNTLFTGKVLLSFDELPSTNDYARAWLAGSTSDSTAKNRPPEGSVIRAAMQSAGRGQYGSTWEATKGENLTFSVILYPKWLGLSQQFMLSMAVALALCDTAEMVLPEQNPVRIKWPNDLYASDRKLAGVLIENSIAAGQFSTAVVGIGLNVNQIRFPDSLPNAGSLASVTGLGFELDKIFDHLLENLEKRYLQLRSGAYDEIRRAYLSKLYRLNTNSSFEMPDGRVFEGIIRGVNDAGRLMVETNERMLDFGVKELRLLV